MLDLKGRVAQVELVGEHRLELPATRMAVVVSADEDVCGERGEA